MPKKMFAAIAAAALAAASSSFSPAACAAGPAGFDKPAAQAQRPGAPKGFEPALTTVADVLKNGRDDQHVTLRGRFTKHIRGDKYEFTDDSGAAVTAELDDDRDWSMIEKDKPVEIAAEIDRDWNKIEIEVKHAKPLP